jgi:K+-sensing histidine kinase KdpD
VEQALGQIIANAAKYSSPVSRIKIVASTENRQLIMSVSDEGVGLTVDEKGRFTERFFRGRRHIGKIAGSGLGVWIANTFITSNGGTLDALSPGENKGTTIRISFPISPRSNNNETTEQED